MTIASYLLWEKISEVSQVSRLQHVYSRHNYYRHKIKRQIRNVYIYIYLLNT